MKKMAPSYSTRRVPGGSRGSSIAFALSSILLTAALAGAAARAAEEGDEIGCSFSEKTNVGCSEPSRPECDGEERLPDGVDVFECREKCCKDPWCGGWRHHGSHGCWHSYDGSLDAECSASNSSQNCRAGGWQGETRRSEFGTTASEGWEGSKTKHGCCPGRWCCPSGKGCCPPWEVHPGAIDDGAAAAHDESAVRGAALLGELELEFLVDEGLNGLLWVCEHGKSGTSLRDLGRSLCLPGDGSDGCARAAVAEAIVEVLGDEIGDTKARRGSLAYVRGSNGCQVRDAAIQRADRFWRRNDGIPDGQCRPQVPTLAFRWLAGSEIDARTQWGAPLDARHRRGEVLISDMLKAIYVNVPKTGSTSVKTALALAGGERTDVWHNLNGATKETYFVFAFARDPMARFVSAYNQVCIQAGTACAFYDDTTAEGIQAFAKYTEAYPCWDEHVCSQTAFFMDREGDPLRIDYLGDTAKLDRGFADLAVILELDDDLADEWMSLAKPSNAKNSASNGPSQQQARMLQNMAKSDEWLTKWVCRFYASDYHCLGYKLPTLCQNAEEMQEEEDGRGLKQYRPHSIYPAFWNEQHYRVVGVGVEMGDSAFDDLVGRVQSAASSRSKEMMEFWAEENVAGIEGVASRIRQGLAAVFRRSGVDVGGILARSVATRLSWNPPPGILRKAENIVWGHTRGAGGDYMAAYLPRCGDAGPQGSSMGDIAELVMDVGRWGIWGESACVGDRGEEAMGGRECPGCVSSAHYRLFFAVDRGDQARVSSPEGGRVDHMIIVTDDSGIANILRDGSYAKSAYPSWSISLFELASNSSPPPKRDGPESTLSLVESALVATLLLARAKHAAGSPQSELFQLVTDLRIGSYALQATSSTSGITQLPQGARKGAGEDVGSVVDILGGARKLWSLDVPIGAGSAGYGSSSNLLPAVLASSGRLSFGTGCNEREEGGKLLQFMPDELVPDGCMDASDDWATQDLMARLQALQHHPTGCSRVQSAAFPNHGAASTMIYLAIQLKRGFREGRPVRFPGEWVYSSRGVSAVFQSTSSCRPASAAKGLFEGRANFGVPAEPSVYSREHLQEVDPEYVPPIFAADGKSYFWYNSVVMSFLFNLTKPLEDVVALAKHQLGLSPGKRYVGVQIRRGDSFDTGRLVAPLEDYVNATKSMCERYGISTVYVSSDSETAVKEFEEAIAGLKVLKWNVDRQFLESNTQKCGSTEFLTRGTGLGIETQGAYLYRRMKFFRAAFSEIGSGNKFGMKTETQMGCEWIEDKLARATQEEKDDQIQGVVVDISMLANADAFVGTFSSAMNRVAWMISRARKGYVKPFITLDMPWCWGGFHSVATPWGGHWGC